MLTGEPWCWTQEQVLKQDSWWIVNFVLWPRDEHGQTKDREPPKTVRPLSAEQRFKSKMRLAGFDERHIDAAWLREKELLDGD